MIPREEQTDDHLAFMDEAVLMGEEALAAREIPVGCVLVHDGKIVARGRNRTNEGRNATLHAEFDALRHLLPDRSHLTTPQLIRPFTPQADDVRTASGEGGKRKAWHTPLKGVVLYVTVEPCLMCASAMRQVGIEKVFYGCANDRFGGTGGVQSIHSDPRLLYAPPYPAVGGYRREEAIMLLRRFYISENTTAPKPKKKSNRVLKTEIAEVTPSPSPSPASFASTPVDTPKLAPAVPLV
ncbi:tRNA(adenine34) deaminase [Rhodotorula paludigena]|uniref:tRNA(adenine34) deaminase n=1 Tax=Rhodotorula paludigena TaxID=86838 RepID=UPI003171A835